MEQSSPLLEIKNLDVSYYTRRGEVPAVVDFNLTLHPGESVGLVGESGCGKSTVSLAIMRHMGANGGIRGGQIKFMGRDMAEMSEDEIRALRGSKISMIYQEPFAALNPCMTIGAQLREVPLCHEEITEEEANARCMQILADVRLPDPERIMAAYPHQLSGGQQQRAVIAMALLSNPKLLLLDEPTTALDVTVEAAIVNIIRDISKKYGTAMIYVSHNMGLILKTLQTRLCYVFRAGRGRRRGRRYFSRFAASLHARFVRLHFQYDRRQKHQSADADSRAVAARLQSPARLLFRSALRFFPSRTVR